MKNKKSLAILITGLLLVEITAHSQNEGKVTRPKFDLTFQEATTSEQLITLGRTARVNIVADATHFPNHPQTLSIQEEDSVFNWALKIANEQKLSLKRENDRTFLFWSEPNVAFLAQSLINDPLANRVAVPNLERNGLVAGRIDNPQLSIENGAKVTTPATPSRGLAPNDFGVKVSAQIIDYLELIHGWDKKSNRLILHLRMSQLPLQLADNIKFVALSQLATSSVNENKSWFSPEIWQQARVAITRPSAKGLATALTVAIPQNKKWLYKKLRVSPLAPQAGAAAPRAKPIALDTTLSTPFLQGAAVPVAAPALRPVVTSEAGALGIDPKLATQVSLEAKEQSLPDVLASLQQKIGIKLQLSPNSTLTQKKVTAWIREMPLSEMMIALSHLYGGDWSKQNDGYQMRDDTRSLAQRELLSVGSLQWFRYWQEPVRRRVAPQRLTFDEPTDWEGEFLNAGLSESLESPQGLAFSSLPKELQTQLRAEVQTQVGLALVRDYSKREVFSQDPLVEVGPSTITIGNKTETALQLAVIGSDGQPVIKFHLENKTIQAVTRFNQELEKRLNPNLQPGQ